MTIWKHCTADIYYQNDTCELQDPGYEVRIDGDELVISYEGETGWVNYRGKDLGGGHYELHADSVNGRAMMHRAPGALILDGCWTENGMRGMWRVRLVE